ncbi:hypothetical protein [Candidatus Electronema sp. JC]|uniref:hypothetical protein n=1 Tax=Candidatus Electronema sp. JC TaxID=3401570 RepID=UPI003B43000F
MIKKIVLGVLLLPLPAVAGLADYGNWCGANNTREDRNYPVKDQIDAVCRKHDLCIRDNGYHKCSCDADFIQGMQKARASSDESERYKIAAIGAFKVKPCECRHKSCIRLCNLRGCWYECNWITTPGMGGSC